MSTEPNGAVVTLEVALINSKIDTLTASLPVPAAPIPKPTKGHGAGATPAYQAPPPASVVITAQFNYGARVPKISQP
jgi:hypothetical protein